MSQTKWQPPIPPGALYSKPALQVGSSIALLAYCYDAVQGDGWLEINLQKAAAEMEIPYRTVKDWWGALKRGPFFCAARDCGRNGWRVQFSPDWLDWRRVEANYPATTLEKEQHATNGHAEGQKRVLEETAPVATVPTQGQKRVLETVSKPLNETLNGPFQGQRIALENLHIGTHDIHPPTPCVVAETSIEIAVGGGGGSFPERTEQAPSEPNETLTGSGKDKPAGGPARNTVTVSDTERWLTAEGMGAAANWGHLPLNAVMADVKRRRGNKQGWGAINNAWKVAPPGTAPPPPPAPAPRRPETREEQYAREQRIRAEFLNGSAAFNHRG